jgi:hypothetical protein
MINDIILFIWGGMLLITKDIYLIYLGLFLWIINIFLLGYKIKCNYKILNKEGLQ